MYVCMYLFILNNRDSYSELLDVIQDGYYLCLCKVRWLTKNFSSVPRLKQTYNCLKRIWEIPINRKLKTKPTIRSHKRIKWWEQVGRQAGKLAYKQEKQCKTHININELNKGIKTQTHIKKKCEKYNTIS